MDLFDAIRTRRSAGSLLDRAPNDEEICELLELAVTAPDHAALRPWRLILLRGAARVKLGRALAEAEAGPAEQLERTAARPLRAPLLMTIVFSPKVHPKVPEWEQLAATTGMVTTLILLHGRDWGVVWRTGSLLDAQPVRDALQLGRDERALGWLYVGENDPNGRRRPHVKRLP